MKSLRTKFVTNTVLSFFVILTLLFSIFAALMHAFFADTVTTLDRMESELVAEEVDMRLGEYRSVTEGLAQNANLVDMLLNCPTPEAFTNDHNFPLIAETMSRIQRENSRLWVFSLPYEYHMYGGADKASRLPLAAKDRAQIATLDTILTNSLVVQYAPEGAEVQYNVITPLRQDGRLIALVGTSIDMVSLLTTLQEKASINTMHTTCSLLVPTFSETLELLSYVEISLDADGQQISESLSLDYPEHFRDGAQPVSKDGASGEKHLSAVGATGWYLTLFVTSETVSNAFLGNYITIGLWGFVLFMAVALSLVAVLAFRLTRPIRDLDSLVADISHGRPYQRLSGNNEVTRAADSLIDLLNDDRSLLKEIKALAEQIALGELFTRFQEKTDEDTQHEIKASLNQMLDNISYILDNLPLGVAVLDEDYRILYANAAICGLLGQETDEMRQGLYLNQLQQLSERARKVVARGIDDCKAGGKSGNGKLFFQKRHLTLTTVQLDAAYADSTKRVFLQVYLNQTDVMEKIQEQEQIFAYFEHLSLVKKEALDRLSKGDFHQANMEIGQRPTAPYLQEIYDNQLEMKWAFRDTVEHIQSIITQMQEATMAFAGGNLHAVIDAQSAKGQYAHLVKTANKAFAVILSYFQSIPVPIRIIDKDYQVVFYNEASIHGGFSPTEEPCCHRWFHAETPCLSCPYAMNDTTLTVREMTLEQNGKQTHWRVYRNPLLDENGAIVSMLEILIDETTIVELKKAADSANLAKSTFIANMSHEIRTPMNAILGYSQLLELNRNLSPENRDYVDIIKRSGSHLLGLINDILELSKIEAGKIELIKEPFDLTRLLDDVQSIFQPQIAAKGLRLLVTTQQVHRHLLGDMGKVRQILMNLISNALKFTSQGEIHVQARSEEKDEGRIRLILDVSDTGSGIAPEEREKVFSAFEQTASGVKSGAGTGLGMVISRNFAMLMDGDLVILDSEVGKGSTFRLTLELPRAQEQPCQSSVAERYGRILGLAEPKTVLVLDATEETRKLLQKLLERIGFSVLCAENNGEALRLWRLHRPDAITTDLSNDDMEGAALVRTIRAEEGEQHTPILVLTANAMRQDQEAALRTGADLYLTKPVVLETLAMELERRTGAEYLFADEIEPICTQGNPSEECMDKERQEQVLQAVLQGDFDTVLDIAAAIATTCPALSARLAELADDFDKDAICTLLEELPQ